MKTKEPPPFVRRSRRKRFQIKAGRPLSTRPPSCRFNEHSLEWAGGGHVPAFLPVQESAAYKALKPNSDYSSLAKTAVFDPVSVLAGVASPVYDAAGNYVVPAMSGEMSAADAAKQMRDDLQSQAK
jgi:multiple sugar transport system substrate-binding protein